MYTIKHIDDDGRESALAVLSWSFDPKESRVIAPAPDGITKYLYNSGRIYVMNERGKTVGDYTLTSKEQHP